MLILIIVLALVAFLVVASGTLVLTTRRRRPRIDTGAPSAPPGARPRAPAPPPAPPARAPAPGAGTAAPPGPATPPVTPTDGPPTEAPVEEAPAAPVAEASGVQAPPGPGTAARGASAPVAPAPAELAELELPDHLPEELGREPAAVGLAEPPRFRDRLGRARSLFSGYLSTIRSRDRIDESTWEDLEEALILADVGLDVTTSLLEGLRGRVRSEKLESPELLLEALKSDVVELLDGDRELRGASEGTAVWLFVGVNGVGKTTTIGKLALREQAQGRRVVMAAGDTFRAAAADQLQGWAERVGAELVRGSEGGDPAAVIYDAVQHASARHADLVLADTAGRLHTKVNLMEELKKVRRVAERPPGQVTEVLLVIDATTGQNGLVQAKQFADAVEVTGVVLTKLDGTAKGGIALAITRELGIPIKAVGLGEHPEDLVEFDARAFVDALFEQD